MELPLNSLLTACSQLERSWQLSEILAAVGPVIDAELGYPHTHLALIGEREGFVTVISHQAAQGNPFGDSDELLKKSQSIEIPIKGDAMLEEILASDHIVVVEDARTDPRTNKDVVAILQNRTLINVPLILADKKLGVLGLGTFTDEEGIRPPLSWHLEFLRLLAGHVAVALDRVRIADFRAKAEQDKLNAVLSLSGQVAHELNTPLGAILSCARSLREDVFEGAKPAFLEAYLAATPLMRESYSRLLATLTSGPKAPPARRKSAWSERWESLYPKGEEGFGERLEQLQFPLDWTEGWQMLGDVRFFTLVKQLVNHSELLTLADIIGDSAEQAAESVRRLRQVAEYTSD